MITSAAFMVGAGMMILVFFGAWCWARSINNYSLVDAVWAFGIGATSGFWLGTGAGRGPKRLIAAGLVILWSVRLGMHLQRRIRRSHPAEDPRYEKLREAWKGKDASGFFWFYQAQALSVLLLALPFLMIARDGSGWSGWNSLGAAVAFIGLAGEALADHQMTLFKRKNGDAKAVCREGLWRYSRHPNYFFESMIWFGFYLFACGSPGGWATVHAPLIILYLVTRVTGIPPTEASALSRKGDAYREYQRTTSAFIPLPPRTPSTHDQHR